MQNIFNNVRSAYPTLISYIFIARDLKRQRSKKIRNYINLTTFLSRFIINLQTSSLKDLNFDNLQTYNFIFYNIDVIHWF